MKTINSATSIRVPWDKGMTRLKWRSKLTCDDAAPVGSAGRRPAIPVIDRAESLTA
jgi:hypothetical protein